MVYYKKDVLFSRGKLIRVRWHHLGCKLTI